MSTRSRWRQAVYPRVRARIVTPFLLVIIVIAGIGVLLTSYLMAGSLQERFDNQLLDSAQAAANAVVEVERSLLETLRAMVFTEGVAAAVEDGDTDLLNERLIPIAANDGLDAVWVFTPDLQGFFGLRRGDDPGDPPYEVAPPRRIAWPGAQRVVTRQPDGEGDKFADLVETGSGLMLFISAPIYVGDEDEQTIVGGIGVGLDMDMLAQRVAAQSLSGVAMYTPDGLLAASTFPGVDPALLSLDGPTVTRYLELAEAGQTPKAFLELDGTPHQVLYAPLYIRGEPVGLTAVGLSTTFLVSSTSTSRDTLAAVFAILFIVVAALGVTIARTIIRPVSKLVETTRAVTAGDLERRVQLNTPDEFGELGESFDRMTDDLVKRNEQIQKLYAAQIKETAQRDAVLANIGDAVIVQDKHGGILLMNRAASDLMEKVTHIPEERREIDALLHTMTSAPDEGKMLAFAGQHFSLRMTPVLLPDGSTLGRVTVFRDVTAIVRAEKLKDELLLQMSHELRTPLAALRGNIDLLRLSEQPKFSEKGNKFFGRTLEHLGTLERLLNQVVDVSTILAERFEIDRRSIDVNEVLNEIAAVWSPRMDSRHLHFEVTLATVPLCIEGDEMRLGQLFDHLLRNAYSYTLPGGSVRVSARAQGSQALVRIVDSGVGISDDEMPFVFDRMYRGSAADAGPTDSRGMGLGLYLAQHIVQAHGGEIQLESARGEGTIARVLLPLEPLRGPGESASS